MALVDTHGTPKQVTWCWQGACRIQSRRSAKGCWGWRAMRLEYPKARDWALAELSRYA